jgi:hypothetical protein
LGAFLNAEGTNVAVGPDGNVHEVEHTAKGNILPVHHLFVLHDKARKKVDDDPASSWVKDYAFFLLDPDGGVVACYSGAERLYGYRDNEIIAIERPGRANSLELR